MEKETFFGAGDFLNLNWDHPSNHTAQLESALSSLVSSPASNSSPPIRELIGRFGGSHHVLSPEEDSVPRPAATTRKRKAAVAPKGKGKETTLPKAEEVSSAKKSKSEETAEPPKQDYIHVRARRGQATDSHSLAERVRREKISERMKFLQDLVPGCNKVTGKAVMLDEIINYVQSLQRQVEFLSMKLSTVNPDTDSLFAKEVPRAHSVFPVDSTGTGFSYGDQPQLAHLQSLMANNNNLGANIRAQFPNFDGFMDSSSQLGAFWEDDLQSVVQMGFGQSQDNVFSSQAFQGSLPTNHMKVEL